MCVQFLRQRSVTSDLVYELQHSYTNLLDFVHRIKKKNNEIKTNKQRKATTILQGETRLIIPSKKKYNMEFYTHIGTRKSW